MITELAGKVVAVFMAGALLGALVIGGALVRRAWRRRKSQKAVRELYPPP